MIKRLTIRVCGRVHGVFFRAKTKEKADSLGLVGWIRNNEDGAVDILVEGEEEKISQLLEWCSKGPESADVESVEKRGEDIKELSFNDFTIKY